ncbi:MAG: hypothetical protein ABIA93_00445 [Candidatus Woesearchaeota archaeon]
MLQKAAEHNLEFITEVSKIIPDKSKYWTVVFRDYYETMRTLLDALVALDGVHSENHQCTNAHACFRHQDPELSWDFLETVRKTRNEVNYRGLMMNYSDWKKYEPEFINHIRKLQGKITSELRRAEN